jgi:hypothetical protein
MTRFNAIALMSLSFVVAGCAGVRVGGPESIKVGDRAITLSGLDGFNAAAIRVPDPNYPLVFVTGGGSPGIVVDQDPIRPPRPEGGTVVITWSLDSEGAYTFPNDTAITFPNVTGSERPDNSHCIVTMPKKKSIICYYDKPMNPKKFKYTVRVVHQNGSEPPVLDPWIQQP